MEGDRNFSPRRRDIPFRFGRSADIFFFAKKLPSSDALIPSDEKGVEFICKLGNSNLKAHFEPQKMTALSGPDL